MRATVRARTLVGLVAGALLLPAGAAGAVAHPRSGAVADPRPGAVAHPRSDPVGGSFPLPATGVPGTTTWWVSPIARVALRRHPWPTARRVGGPAGRLHRFTEDGFPEVDIVTRQWLTRAGDRWLHVRQPARPHAVGGWVPARVESPLTQVHTRLVVDRGAERATLYRDGRVIWSARVGTGKASTPTPPGSYWVREKFAVPGDGLYGTRAFGTSDYSPYETDWPEGGIVGIHGTDEPQLIPGHPSHGCIRMRNADVQRLYPLMPVGTPVVIR